MLGAEVGTCGVARLLFPATVVAFGVATLVGDDAAGWIAGGLTALLLLAVQRGRGAVPSCAVTPPTVSRPAVDPAGTAPAEAPPAPTVDRK